MAELRVNSIVPGIRAALLGDTPVPAVRAFSDVLGLGMDVTGLVLMESGQSIAGGFTAGNIPVGPSVCANGVLTVPNGQIWFLHYGALEATSGGDSITLRSAIVDVTVSRAVHMPDCPVQALNVGASGITLPFAPGVWLLPGFGLGAVGWAQTMGGGSGYTVQAVVTRYSFA